MTIDDRGERLLQGLLPKKEKGSHGAARLSGERQLQRKKGTNLKRRKTEAFDTTMENIFAAEQGRKKTTSNIDEI